MVAELAYFRAAGGGTVVELTTLGLEPPAGRPARDLRPQRRPRRRRLRLVPRRDRPARPARHPGGGPGRGPAGDGAAAGSRTAGACARGSSGRSAPATRCTRTRSRPCGGAARVQRATGLALAVHLALWGREGPAGAGHPGGGRGRPGARPALPPGRAARAPSSTSGPCWTAGPGSASTPSAPSTPWTDGRVAPPAGQRPPPCPLPHPAPGDGRGAPDGGAAPPRRRLRGAPAALPGRLRAPAAAGLRRVRLRPPADHDPPPAAPGRGGRGHPRPPPPAQPRPPPDRRSARPGARPELLPEAGAGRGVRHVGEVRTVPAPEGAGRSAGPWRAAGRPDLPLAGAADRPLRCCTCWRRRRVATIPRTRPGRVARKPAAGPAPPGPRPPATAGAPSTWIPKYCRSTGWLFWAPNVHSRATSSAPDQQPDQRHRISSVRPYPMYPVSSIPSGDPPA